MKLKTCMECEFGVEKEGNSFCRSESCYSHLTNCIQKKALSLFLEGDKVVRRQIDCRGGENRVLQ